MADTKTSALTALSGAPAVDDLLMIVDISDTTMAGTGTNKYIRTSDFLTTPGITGQVTVTYTDAGTNTVLYNYVANRQSSGTPANGIGVGWAFDVETAAGNTERGATIEAVTTDVASTSEDFDLVFKTMAAGATAANRLKIRSVENDVHFVSGLISSGNGSGEFRINAQNITSRVSMLHDFTGRIHSTSTGSFGFANSSTIASATTDAAMARSGVNSITFAETFAGAGGAGVVTSRTEINKAVTAIPDATVTTVFTVTVPNAAHSAMIEVGLTGSLGAGGAIGANEATGTATYQIAVARTAGVNAVASISSVYGSTTAAVAGAATITVTGNLGAVSGAVGASNTFTIRVTITKGSGSSANHTCLAYARLMNANATGITIL